MQIELEKAQSMLEWTKTKLYLDTQAPITKSRVVKRGEVYSCNFGVGVGSEIQKFRPCVIIQNDTANINSGNVIVAPITHTFKKIPSICKIEAKMNEKQNKVLDGFINLANIQTVSKARLGDYITVLNDNDIKHINHALIKVLDIKNI